MTARPAASARKWMCGGSGEWRTTRTTRGFLLSEQPWCELAQGTAPGQPLVRRFRRFEIDVFHAGLGQRLAEVLRTRPFGRADAEEKHLHFAIEGRGIGER